VFVHGWSCDRSYWREQLEHFAVTNRVVAIDLAGHGESGLNREEWTIAAFGEDVAAVVNGLGLEQVVLVGHSMGASVIVEATRRASDRVMGLVVVDDFIDLDAPMTTDQIEGLVAPFYDDFSGTTRGFVTAAMFVPESDPALVEWIAEDMASAPPNVGMGAVTSLLQWYGEHADQALSEVDVPIRAINSDMHPMNFAAAEKYGIEVTLMSGVGHFVMMEDPGTFNSLLSEAIADFER
jgi:pimeloyl-ACP methyl ester carboxylesterase